MNEVTIIRDRSAQVSAAVLEAVSAAVRQTQEAILARVAEEMSAGKTGRTYTHGPQPLPHQASAPGESPATWTGQYLRDTSISPIAQQGAVVVGSVGTTSEYGLMLEFGTRKVAPPPTWLTIAEEQGGELAQRTIAELKRRL